MKLPQNPNSTIPDPEIRSKFPLHVLFLALVIAPLTLVLCTPAPIYAAYYKTLGGALTYSAALLFAITLFFLGQLRFFQIRDRIFVLIVLLIIPALVFLTAAPAAQISTLASH